MNFKNKTAAYIKITRPVNVLITFATIFLAGLICPVDQLLINKIILASVSGALVAAAGNVINDYFDVETDKINRPHRVIPKKLMTKKEALAFFAILKFFAFYLALQINKPAFAIVLITSFLLFIYSFKLKRIALVGNIVVGILTGMAFIYGAVAVGNWKAGIFPALFAFMVNLAREVLKDIEDIEGDVKSGFLTFPVKFGIKHSINLIAGIIILLIIFTTIPYFLGIYNIKYFIFVLIIVDSLFVYFVKELFNNVKPENLRRLSNLLKINMLLGLTAIYLGSNISI